MREGEGREGGKDRRETEEKTATKERSGRESD